MVHGFLQVVCFRVPFPFDQILELPSSPVMVVIYNGLHFKFFFAGIQVRWWPCVVGAVLSSFAIRCQQTGMKDVMDSSGWG